MSHVTITCSHMTHRWLTRKSSLIFFFHTPPIRSLNSAYRPLLHADSILWHGEIPDSIHPTLSDLATPLTCFNWTILWTWMIPDDWFPMVTTKSLTPMTMKRKALISQRSQIAERSSSNSSMVNHLKSAGTCSAPFGLPFSASLASPTRLFLESSRFRCRGRDLATT